MKKLGLLVLLIPTFFVSIFVISQIIGQKTLANMENPHILVQKKARTLQIFNGQTLIKTYKISLGFKPEGDKEIEGDGKTPEGDFYVYFKNEQSAFYLSLGISYPNIEDATRGLKENLITQSEYDEIVKANKEKTMPPQKTKLGGEIFIHGGGCDVDWTAGCMALTNVEMKEIFDVIFVGTSVKIEP